MTENAGFSTWNSQALSQALYLNQISTQNYVDWLKRVIDHNEASVQALIDEPSRFDRIHRELDSLKQRFPPDKQKPLLFGLPVAVKDVIRVDGHKTSAGCRLPSHLFLGQQAIVVNRLRKAGAIILGKSVTAEFAFLTPGPTRNPVDNHRTPGGSSSGSAAAIAAGYCPLALGTQTVGSINRPAAFCGVVGFKPSFNAISTAGVIPLAPACDHVGILARDMSSLQLASHALLSRNLPPAPIDNAQKPVLLVPQGPYLDLVEAEARQHFENVLQYLQTQGYSVKKVNAFEDFEDTFKLHHQLVAYQAARTHAGWYSHYAAAYSDETRELIEKGRKVDLSTVQTALASQKKQRDIQEQSLKSHAANLWISPSAVNIAPQGLASTGNSVMQLPWTHSGLPLLNLNAGLLHQLPLGVQLAAPLNTDHTLLNWAAALESCLKEYA